MADGNYNVHTTFTGDSSQVEAAAGRASAAVGQSAKNMDVSARSVRATGLLAASLAAMIMMAEDAGERIGKALFQGIAGAKDTIAAQVAIAGRSAKANVESITSEINNLTIEKAGRSWGSALWSPLATIEKNQRLEALRMVLATEQAAANKHEMGARAAAARSRRADAVEAAKDAEAAAAGEMDAKNRVYEKQIDKLQLSSSMETDAGVRDALDRQIAAIRTKRDNEIRAAEEAAAARQDADRERDEELRHNEMLREQEHEAAMMREYMLGVELDARRLREMMQNASRAQVGAFGANQGALWAADIAASLDMMARQGLHTEGF